MPYIGNPIYQSAFVTDQFSGDGTTTAFTMSVAPAGTTNVLVVVSGVVQDPTTYGVVGTTLNFSAAPPSGTGNISCRYLGVPVTGVTTTAYRTVTEFTATASQTTFTPPSYSVGFINVYLNGVLLGSADYTATNGTTVVLATGASAGNILTVESFRIESVANAISNTAGSVSSSNLASGIVTPAKLSTGGPSWTTGGVLTVAGFAGEGLRLTSTSTNGSKLQIFSNAQTSNQLQIGQGYATGTDNIAYVYNGANADLLFATNATERMRIDSSGRVTMPYQPRFNCRLTSGNYGGSTTIVWNDVQINNGSYYNNTNGLFTAPVAGTYFFSCRMRGTGGGLNPIWVKNGVDQAYFGTINGSDSLSGTWMFTLAAGDTVSVRNVGGTIQGTPDYHSVFNGYLLG